MRYLVGFVLVAALVASSLGVSAQAGEEGSTSETGVVVNATVQEGQTSANSERELMGRAASFPQ